MKASLFNACALLSAATMIATTQPLLAGQENTARIQVNNLPAGLNASGIATATRTSDAGADFVGCVIQPNSTSCTASNDNTFVPKNIGNVACIPKNLNYPALTAQCNNLLSAGSGNCQTNSAAGVCNARLEWEIKPICNYRTSSSSSTSANWTWQLNASTVSGNAFTLDCSQTGFQGYTQD